MTGCECPFCRWCRELDEDEDELRVRSWFLELDKAMED